MAYEKELSYIKEKVKKAFNLYAELSEEDIHQKSVFDIVTDTDLNIERYLIKEILSCFPDDHILSEEYNSENKIIDRTWIIDPIDGTCNFTQGIPLYGVQCALVENKQVVLSYLYLPIFNEEYYAVINEGAWKNGKKISVKANELNHSIVSFGDYPHVSIEYSKVQNRAIGHIMERIAKIRMFGAACIDFAYAASGKTNGCVLITNNSWDILPGMFLCKEAGAIITNLKGEEYEFYDDGIIIAADKNLHSLITKSMNL